MEKRQKELYLGCFGRMCSVRSNGGVVMFELRLIDMRFVKEVGEEAEGGVLGSLGNVQL